MFVDFSGINSRILLKIAYFIILYRDSEIQEYRDTIQGYAGIQGYRNTGIQGYRDTGIQEYRNTGIQGYRDTGIQGYRGAWKQRYRDT